MPKRAHLIAGMLGLLCIATFFVSTIIVELFGSPAAVAHLKSLIVAPGLWILIPALAGAGSSGMVLAKSRRGRLVDAKKRRMPFIAANGLLVLVPSAIFLNRLASAGTFDATFYILQALELLAGATNLSLMGMNLRDGLRLSGRLRVAPPAARAS
ncbi:MAG TPA: hypothetical protein VMG60_22640 [Burkholderiaceae bacterium]|nr:hypothetical protein [Burkholderiaceae bacterium]